KRRSPAFSRNRIERCAFFRHPDPRFREGAMVLLELFAFGTDIVVSFGIEREVAARESPIRALELVEHFHMRLDPTLVLQPTKHLRRAIACVGGQTRRGEVELFGSAVEHRLGPTSAWRMA